MYMWMYVCVHKCVYIVFPCLSLLVDVSVYLVTDEFLLFIFSNTQQKSQWVNGQMVCFPVLTTVDYVS